jgi:hypothetical protein
MAIRYVEMAGVQPGREQESTTCASRRRFARQVKDGTLPV